MNYDVIEARYVRDYVIWLKFRDGTSGEIDLESELWGEVFEPLKDLAFFRQFSVHPEFETLVWPNGADFAPLLVLVRGRARSGVRPAREGEGQSLHRFPLRDVDARRPGAGHERRNAVGAVAIRTAEVTGGGHGGKARRLLPLRHGGLTTFARGYGGPPKLHAKAEGRRLPRVTPPARP